LVVPGVLGAGFGATTGAGAEAEDFGVAAGDAALVFEGVEVPFEAGVAAELAATVASGVAPEVTAEVGLWSITGALAEKPLEISADKPA
jgi:hypothetical protein